MQEESIHREIDSSLKLKINNLSNKVHNFYLTIILIRMLQVNHLILPTLKTSTKIVVEQGEEAIKEEKEIRRNYQKMQTQKTLED